MPPFPTVVRMEPVTEGGPGLAEKPDAAPAPEAVPPAAPVTLASKLKGDPVLELERDTADGDDLLCAVSERARAVVIGVRTGESAGGDGLNGFVHIETKAVLVDVGLVDGVEVVGGRSDVG